MSNQVQKQSAFVMLARSCMATIRGNIMFNGPRAGVNFNDHFGGANALVSNLIFNVCRFNSAMSTQSTKPIS